MPKDQEPADQASAFMEQAQQAVDTYFDFLKKSVSSFPSGGTELGETLKDQAVENVTAVHEFCRPLDAHI